jgi:aldehyde:ferredoxin oxidoreductase
MYGYWGKILKVDLTKEIYHVDRVKEAFFKKYLGGAGIGTKLVFDGVDPNTDPLSPENILVFAVGPFQSTTLLGSGRWAIISKSPQTGIYADSGAGAAWGPRFKRTGFDALTILGRAKTPVYLWIHEGEVEIRDASAMWGKMRAEADEEIKDDVSEPRAAVACIGPAGENLVRFACVGDDHGIAGRTGLGAVMGSKNLKAVAVYGTQPPAVAKPDELAQLSKDLWTVGYEKQKDGMRLTSTIGGMKNNYETGEFGMKNWTQGLWDEAPHLYPESVRKALSWTPIACLNCPVACHKKATVSEPAKYAYEGYGPEYESVGMLGTLTLISDPKAVGYLHYLCDEYGLDTITAGALVAFCMECYEQGWITKDDMDGTEPTWGNADAAVSLLHMIAKRQGFGTILAEGTLNAAHVIGKGASKTAVHVKNLDLPAHDPRATFSWSVNYATGPRGACHQRGFAGWNCGIPEWGIPKVDRHTMSQTGLLAAKYQDWASIFNSLIQCEFMIGAGITMTHQIQLLNLVTGWDIDIEWMATTGERITTLQRVVNVQYGVSKKDDVLPERIFTPVREGGTKGQIPVPFEKELQAYYELRGWNRDGKPTVKKLAELGLLETLKPVWD